jgi:hypothetical protein
MLTQKKYDPYYSNPVNSVHRMLITLCLCNIRTPPSLVEISLELCSQSPELWQCLCREAQCEGICETVSQRDIFLQIIVGLMYL